jgi:NADP-dependent aldehyde dehydrogenase
MSSTNPVFVLPSALRERGKQIAGGLFNSFTASAGQMCTKPGLVFLPEQQESEGFLSELRGLTSNSSAFTLLTPGIAAGYQKSIRERSGRSDNKTSEASNASGTSAALLETQIDDFLKSPELSHELFGPSSLIIRYQERAAILEAAEALDGHLTATVIGNPEDLVEYRDLIQILERKAGRIIFNGYPTGVEVSHAMVHGGPYPSTSDSRFTSVGSMAIFRFARPVCYQGLPESALPEELRDTNPLGIQRMVNGKTTTGPVKK